MDEPTVLEYSTPSRPVMDLPKPPHVLRAFRLGVASLLVTFGGPVAGVIWCVFSPVSEPGHLFYLWAGAGFVGLVLAVLGLISRPASLLCWFAGMCAGGSWVFVLWLYSIAYAHGH